MIFLSKGRSKILNHCCGCFLFMSYVLVLVSCTGERINCPFPPENAHEKLMEASSEPQVHVYYDASRSMAGFTTPASSVYKRVLECMESSVKNNTHWKKPVVRFFKFGGTIRELKTRKEILEATTQGFYSEKGICEKTMLHNVINSTDADKFIVIITDLFQNDSDVNLLVEKIKDKFISKDRVIGLVGLMSEFNGVVSEVGFNGFVFHYPNNENAFGRRPFYLLLLGKHKDVECFFNCLDSNILKQLNQENFLILSHHLAYPSPNFEEVKIKKIEKVKIDEIRSILPPSPKDYRVKQFIIRKNVDSSSFKIELPFKPLPYTFCSSPVTFETKAFANKVEIDKKKQSSLSLLSGIDQAFNTLDVHLEGAKLKFQVKIDPKKLPAPGVYVFEQIIYPNPEEFKVPEWISQWDMEAWKIELWKLKPNTFKGNTTLNLRRFVSDLWQATVQKHNPELAHLYYYIKKE